MLLVTDLQENVLQQPSATAAGRKQRAFALTTSKLALFKGSRNVLAGSPAPAASAPCRRLCCSLPRHTAHPRGSAMSEAEVLEDLPAEMQQAVFSHLDLPSVRALRRVSHAVRALIGSRDFQKARHSVRSEPAHCRQPAMAAYMHHQSSMPRAAPTFGPPPPTSRLGRCRR